MKKEDLARALNDIDEKYILEADPETASDENSTKVTSFRQKRIRQWGSLVAACLVCVIGINVYNGYSKRRMNDTAKSEDTQPALMQEINSEAEEQPAQLYALNNADAGASKAEDAEATADESYDLAAAPEGAAEASMEDGAEAMEEAAVEQETCLASTGNPWEDHETLKEAETAAGFNVVLPENAEMISDWAKLSYRTMKDYMIEVIYSDEEENEGLRIRKASGWEDVSGDYNTYQSEETVTLEGTDTEVTLRGDGKYVGSAIWHDSDYSYAIDLDQAKLTQEEVLELIAQIDN